MAKDYREITLNYNTTSQSIEVLTSREVVTFIGAVSTKRTLDLTEYHQFISTNNKRVFTYQFAKANSDLYDFFNDAFESFLAGNTVTMDRELDDGTTETLTVHITKPQYQDDNITNTSEKVYNNLICEISEV